MICKARIVLADALIPKQGLFLVSDLVTDPKNRHEGGRPKA